MSLTVSATSSTVAVVGAVTTTLTGTPTQTVKAFTYAGGSTAVQTLGTVGAGKTWYVIGWSVNFPFTTSTLTVKVTLNGVDVWVAKDLGVASTLGGTTNATVMLPLGCSMTPLTTGQTVQFDPGSNNTPSCTVYYIEV